MDKHNSLKTKTAWTGRVFWGALLAVLLYWALRSAPLVEIWLSLRQLKIWQVLALLAVNGVIFTLITLRWWLIVRAESRRVPFLPMIGYRLSAFGLSYFTPGPQVGGEPLQILYLQKNYGLTFARATAAVIMDKLLEFLANFIFLAIGLVAIVQVGLVSGVNQQVTSPGSFLVTVVPLVILLLWPLVHIILLYYGRYPLGTLMRAIQPRLASKSALSQTVRLVMVAERMAASFTRRHLGVLLAALISSLLWWVGMVFEYFMMLGFLNIQLDLWQTLAALSAGLLAFLVPLPAGLGALEASQVYVITSLGFPAAAGISLSLLVRGRDIVFGGLGLLLAGAETARKRK